jgi:hypothetical protein
MMSLIMREGMGGRNGGRKRERESERKEVKKREKVKREREGGTRRVGNVISTPLPPS